ncbi:VOC family protein [Chitinimonas sp.]|uniref:VOC family protein n=1 Tax=Chitinimonas sp. TaxID=1934313 RepID=UPI002F94209A
MTQANYVLLYVDNTTESAAFYTRLLDLQPVETAPTFALFVQPNGLKLGLWSRHTALPTPTTAGGGGEIGFHVESRDEVARLHAHWQALGLTILQAPTEMDFGYTFVALDPDQHRLRVFALSI